uniref:agamous-like MADS-box protein AGL62 n=1 Tax=Erigeron canadensis TaxID=72917 RepID=UPI001CB8AF55|nr:agamous-like MADS-box protein AGL62 [Erigeron canadensis]
MEDLTHIADSSIVIKKKKTKGRQKIDPTKKIVNPSSLQVAFSKRRTGLFKKAAELCVLTGAQIAILTQSPGGRIFSFGHPNVDVVIDRFLDIKDSNFKYEEEIKNPKETSNLMWFDEPIDGMNLEELEEYLHSLVELKNNVDRRADELMMINTNPRILGPDFVHFGLNNGFPMMSVH